MWWQNVLLMPCHAISKLESGPTAPILSTGLIRCREQAPFTPAEGQPSLGTRLISLHNWQSTARLPQTDRPERLLPLILIVALQLTPPSFPSCQPTPIRRCRSPLSAEPPPNRPLPVISSPIIRQHLLPGPGAISIV